MNSKQGTKSLDMTQGSPTRLLILFSIPMLIGGVFQLLYSMVDTIVVGRYVDVSALAAIGAASSTANCIMFLGQGLTNAASVIIAQAKGAKSDATIKKAVAHAAYLVLGSGIFLGLLAFFGAYPMMQLLGTPDDIIDQAVSYIQITGGLTIALIAYNGVASVLRAIGDSRTPLYFLIFSSLLNVGLDLVFVLVFHGGIAGVAYATVISQIVSAVLCILYMIRKYPQLRPDRAAWRFDGKMFKEYLRIGMPMCLQSLVLCIGMFVITAVINSFGSSIVAAYTIGSKVEQLATVTFSNVAFSFSVYAGQNYGAKKYLRIKEGLKKGLLIIGGLALLSSAIMLLFAEPLSKAFMDQYIPEVLDGAVAMIRVEAVLYIALGAIWTVNSALRGMGFVKISLVSSIVELLSKIGLSISLPLLIESLGITTIAPYIGIWIASPAGWVLGLIPSCVYLIYWFKKGMYKEEPQVPRMS